MSNLVFVLDTNRKPLIPCTPGMARSLLKAGKAAVFRQYPFTIILNKEVENTTETLRVLCRASGSFDIATKTGRVAGISHKYCKPIHKKDGYNYAF